MNKENFCNVDSELSTTIPNLLCDHLFTSDMINAIKSRYDDMRRNFDVPANADAWGIKGTEYSNKLFDYSINMDIPFEKCRYEELSDKSNIGVDLPTWINSKKGNKKIMIISQDPLRSDYGNYKGRIIVSSPFGLQNSDYRKNVNCKRYLRLFDLLIENGNGLYLTDFRKIYVGSNAKTYSEKIAFERNAEIMKAEITAVNPDVIITISKDAFVGITGLEINISKTNILESKFYDKYQGKPVLPFIHLSWAAAKSQNVFKETNQHQSNETLQEFYGRLIKSFLDK